MEQGERVSRDSLSSGKNNVSTSLSKYLIRETFSNACSAIPDDGALLVQCRVLKSQLGPLITTESRQANAE